MTGVQEFLQSYLQDLKLCLDKLDRSVLEIFLKQIAQARQRDRMVFVCGNGGSALTSSHFAVDLGKGASLGKPRRFKVVALTDNVGTITALGNDLDYASVFVEQLKNLATPDDLLLAISGSGNSPNVLRAVEYANQLGMVSLGLTGEPGGDLAKTARHVLRVPSNHMGRIEDVHMVVAHLLTYFFMEEGHFQ